MFLPILAFYYFYSFIQKCPFSPTFCWEFEIEQMALGIRLEINFRVYRQDILQAPWKKQSIGFHFLEVLFHQWQCLTCNYGSSNTWWMNRQLYSRDYSWHGVLFFYSLYIFLYIPLSSPILRQVACHFPFHMSQFNEMSLWKISLNTD